LIRPGSWSADDPLLGREVVEREQFLKIVGDMEEATLAAERCSYPILSSSAHNDRRATVASERLGLAGLVQPIVGVRRESSKDDSAVTAVDRPLR
jgi:hypothetical protein